MVLVLVAIGQEEGHDRRKKPCRRSIIATLVDCALHVGVLESIGSVRVGRRSYSSVSVLERTKTDLASHS